MSRVVVDADALQRLVVAAAASPDRRVQEALATLVRQGTMPAAPEWLTVDQAADRFGVSERTVRREAVERGTWPALRIGRRLLVASSGPERSRADSPVDRPARGPDADGRQEHHRG